MTSSRSPNDYIVKPSKSSPSSTLRTYSVWCAKPDGAYITAWIWLRSMIEHEIHHRGQIYIYLSLLDAPNPPLYGLTSEQVQERSIQVKVPTNESRL